MALAMGPIIQNQKIVKFTNKAIKPTLFINRT